MRFLAAVAVATLGIGCYAVAALLYDRRRQLVGWLERRRPTTPAPAAGALWAAGSSAGQLYLVILGVVVVGSVLLVGACVGLIVF